MVMQLLRSSLLVILTLFSTVVAAQATEVIASVDKNPIIQGEPFTLTVTINDDVSQTAWDPEQSLSDFRVLNTRSSRRTSVINGETTRTTAFIVTLQAPSNPGIVRIPPITIAGSSSEAIELTVLDANSAASEQEQRPAFIRTSLESDRVYVQQQFKLVARLYLSANLHSGNLIAPQLELAEVSQFGKDEESYEIINGKRYQVFQRTYLITPQRSGQLTIEGPMFEGQISRETSRSLFSSIATTQPVSTIAAPINIEVLPRPADWDHHWLPSELVSIGVEHIDPQTDYAVGQPIAFTYRMTAIGVNPEQLPRISHSKLDGASVYPETPELSSTVRNGRVIAQRTETIAIIPRESGELVIPAVEFTWFNTRLGQAQVASSDALKFTISPAAGLQHDRSHTQQRAAEVSEPVPEPALQPKTAATAIQSNYLVLAIVFAALWFVTLCLWAWWWLRQSSPRTVAKTTQPHTPATIAAEKAAGNAWKQLQQAAHRNDPIATDKALRTWAAQHQLAVTDLSDIAKHFNYPPLSSQIDHLQRSRYAGKPLPWQEGKALLRALKAAMKQLPAPSTDAPTLPPLYPR